MTGTAAREWDAEIVRNWLKARIVAARSDQAVADRTGRSGQDDCDKATAEEMVCSLVNSERSTASQIAFAESLRALLDRDDYVWRGINDDRRFDRYVRSFAKKLIGMAKANAGFENTGHYQ